MILEAGPKLEWGQIPAPDTASDSWRHCRAKTGSRVPGADGKGWCQ